MSKRQRFLQGAYREYKVTRQISTGNGETYLAAAEDPPRGFVSIELGYGVNERPCSDCFKPCTIERTMSNLDEINLENLRTLDLLDPLSVPDRLSSVDGDVRRRFGLGSAPQTNAYGDLPAQALKKHRRKLTARDARRALRAQAKRAGVRVVKGEYVDDRPRGWTPGSSTRPEREARAADELGRALAAMNRRLERIAKRESAQQAVAA